MRSQVKMVKQPANANGEYAISMEFLDETNWSPSIQCLENDLMCPLPDKTALECVGDYCGAHLPLSDFSGKDLNNSRFAGSDLSCANFRNSKLASADFSNADLCQTALTHADLRGAIFDGADLSFADLSFADLRGARLSDVRFANVEVKGARFDRQTTLPISRDEAESRGMIYCF